jgi:RimJ/RimL family protein N-acetyltransferase
MNLERFAPATDGDAVRACYRIFRAGAPADDPQGPPLSLRFFTGWIAMGWTEDPPECWLARDEAGETCGFYVLTVPQRENRHLAEIFPTVLLSRRREGLGTELLRHAAARAHDLGRAVLSSDCREGSPGGEFARGAGAQPGLAEIRRMLAVDAIPAGHLARLRGRAESAASGYSLLCWEGATPEDRLAEAADVNMAMADAPRGAGHEAQRWDAARVRQDERRVAAQGMRLYTVAARSNETGRLAGLSQVGIDPCEPAWGFQELTAVARPHRGHRLGLLVKVAMLEWLAEREPQLTRILTGNADGNEHMIAINTEIGFTILDRWLTWEIGVAKVLTGA